MQPNRIDNITLNPLQAAVVSEWIERGVYPSADVAVEAAIRLLTEQAEDDDRQLDHVRQMIEVGARQLDAGQEVEGESVFRRLRERRERMRGASPDAS